MLILWFSPHDQLAALAAGVNQVWTDVQVEEYDQYLVGFQRASISTENIAAVLNAGQGLVLAGGLTAVLASATYFTPVGKFTAGDLVIYI